MEAPARDFVLALGREHLPVQITDHTSGSLTFMLAGGPQVSMQSDWRPGEPIWRGTVDGEPVIAQVRREGHAVRVGRGGASVLARLMTPRAAELALLMPEKQEADTSKHLRCPMPGLVVSIAVSEGQHVAAGEALAVVEAMKMENVLRAERSATVSRIRVRPGDSLAVDAVIMEFA